MTNKKLSLAKWDFHPVSAKNPKIHARITADNDGMLVIKNDDAASNELADRLVACANACRGLATHDLKTSGLVSAVGHQLARQDKTISDLLEVVKCALAWIDGVPKDTPLPTMEGFDRDWADSVVSAAVGGINPTPANSFPVYACASCEGIYLEKVSQCDCMPDKQEFREYLAIPAKKE